MASLAALLVRVPVFKRLVPSLFKQWVKYTWTGGHKIVRYYGAHFMLAGDNYVDRTIALYGNFEEQQLNYMLAAASRLRPACFFDIGANFGLYSVVMARYAADIQVHSYEPDMRNYAQLQGNIWLNHIADGRVQAWAVALSDQAGPIGFQGAAASSTGQSRVDIHHAHQVPAIRLDESAAGQLQRQSLMFKIDIEGHELAALRGMQAILQNNQCFLQIEIFDDQINAVKDFMQGLGYRIIHRIDFDYYFEKHPS